MMQNIPLNRFERDEFFQYIFEAYHESLYFQARKLCKHYKVDLSIAKDLLQDFYCKVWHDTDVVFKGYSKRKGAYLMTVLNHKMVDYYRKNKSYSRMKGKLSEKPKRFSDVHYSLPEIPIDRLKVIMFELLSKEDYEVMILYAQGYQYKEIAKELGLKINTVGTKIKRCKAILRPYFYKL